MGWGEQPTAPALTEHQGKEHDTTDDVSHIDPRRHVEQRAEHAVLPVRIQLRVVVHLRGRGSRHPSTIVTPSQTVDRLREPLLIDRSDTAT